jgi:hypothetical protein
MRSIDYVLLGIVILILIILISINYSYRSSNRNSNSNNTVEGYTSSYTYNTIIDKINENKDYLNEIAKNRRYVIYPDKNNVNQYINSDSVIKDDHQIKLQQDFNVNFLQHLQDKEIESLEADLAELDKLKKQMNPDERKISKGLKGVNSGAILKIGYKDDGKYDFINKPKFSLVMDENKQSCVSYEPSKNVNMNNEVITVKEVGCDYDINNNQQKFNYKKITSNGDFNNALHPDNKNYAIADYYQLNNYPFYIIHPFDKDDNGKYDVNTNECLTLNSDGLSVEPCILKQTQQFLLSDL